jgi:hypothetical protein
VPAEPGEAIEVAEVRVIEPARSSALAAPAARAATLTATGFVAGVAAAAVMRRSSTRRLTRRRRKRGVLDGLPIVGSRSFLVDVHLLDRG